MSSVKRFMVGDKVNIFFENVEAEINVTITYMPVATGDGWIVERENGTIVAVQNFAKMERLNDD